jgi:hypothetical protein
MGTLVKVKCISKKETVNYDVAYPKATAIELQVPYDPKSIFYQMSGGTGILLQTVNQDAADEFIIGKEYDVRISLSEQE